MTSSNGAAPGGPIALRYIGLLFTVQLPTAWDAVEDCVRGLGCGAASYLIGPVAGVPTHMAFLARNRGMTLTQEQILLKTWEYDFGGSSNIVDVYVSQLRRKLRMLNSNATIVTVWGAGYKLIDASAQKGE
ncbi:MAG: winged helix-turn-helix transcriptional regulator [Candidatus Eremiobacteraeota bacterium]|nr:winged helix-turn-helix transcriptional regulator [Candidatus Eremiobacteraeota bacterium]MBC5822074.1 winged helix-turn-helix transcriptional regulator [Candidatus Eremiobacteraeota bacterium]